MNDKTQSILLGGAVVAVLSTSYLGFINACCCAGVVLGAMAAVWHYTNTNSVTITPGEGAKMGVLAALVGGVIAFILNLILAEMGLGAEAAIQEFIMTQFADSMPPESLEQMEEQFAASSSMGARAINGVIGLVVSALFGALGGVIGASVFKKGTDDASDATAV